MALVLSTGGWKPGTKKLVVLIRLNRVPSGGSIASSFTRTIWGMVDSETRDWYLQSVLADGETWSSPHFQCNLILFSPFPRTRRPGMRRVEIWRKSQSMIHGHAGPTEAFQRTKAGGKIRVAFLVMQGREAKKTRSKLAAFTPHVPRYSTNRLLPESET
ncbi:hypothetical protein L209DRAFT_496104 [Thermothelomyces heterothallicus CBS 203.75]